MNERAVAARVLRDVAKMSVASIAELLNAHEATVYRWLQSEAEAQQEHHAADNVEALLDKQQLDEVGQVHAGIARTVAAKLDRASASDKAQDSMAVPGLAKELRAVIAEIMGASADDKEWLADVFGPVGHSENAKPKDPWGAGSPDSG